MGKNIERWEDQRPGPGLASNQDFTKGKKLNQKLQKFQKKF